MSKKQHDKNYNNKKTPSFFYDGVFNLIWRYLPFQIVTNQVLSAL
jgi:hypothetical protein